MNEITVSAKTLDDAITEASIQLGVASDQMEYDVIEKGSAGFLGIGSRQAVIRARIKKTVTEATQKICEKFLQEVLQAMGMGEVTIVSSIDEEGALAIEMSGDNMGILIGKRGQTLDSLQYLTNRVANKSQDGYVRVKLDTEDYRKRRKQTLENLAKNIAYKVKRSRKPISLEPMNPYERRIIHSALQADDRVSTHSEGEEPYRRVVVTPNRR